MSSFTNTFAVLKDINDKKKTIVISDKPKAKKPKSEKPAEVKAAAPAAAPLKAADTTAKAAKKAPAANFTNEPPKNSLQLAKETLKRQQAEAAAKAVPAEAAEQPIVAEAEVAAEPVAEAPVAEGDAAVVAVEQPVPEAPKLTMEEYKKLQEQKRFAVAPKPVRRVDPNAKVEGFEILKVEIPVKVAPKAAPAKAAAAPAKVAPKAVAKGAKAAAPAPAAPQKTAPKEKKEKVVSLGEFAAIVDESARGRGRGGFRGGRGGFRGGFRGGRGGASEVNVEDTKLFPSL